MSVLWVLAGLAAAMPLAAVLWWRRRRAGDAMPARQRHARRQDENGQRLLEMAQEMELHAHQLDDLGLPSLQARRWARDCRQAAVEHLACINALLFDPSALGNGGRRRGPRG